MEKKGRITMEDKKNFVKLDEDELAITRWIG